MVNLLGDESMMSANGFELNSHVILEASNK
jgi:hypothetical protein